MYSGEGEGVLDKSPKKPDSERTKLEDGVVWESLRLGNHPNGSPKGICGTHLASPKSDSCPRNLGLGKVGRKCFSWPTHPWGTPLGPWGALSKEGLKTLLSLFLSSLLSI